MVRRSVRINRSKSERGETLLEVLMALLVLGLAGVALIGAFTTVIGASSEHRTLSTNDVVLKDFAESATNQIQLQQPSPYFLPCATFGGTATNSSPSMTYSNGSSSHTISFTPPVGYSVQVTQVQYLFNNSTFQSSGCDSTQFWPQLITAQATGPKGTANLSFVVSDPQKETYVFPTSTTTSTTPTTTTLPVSTPTITFPTTANPYNAGHNQGVETLHITGTNLQNTSSVTVSGAFAGVTIVSKTATVLTITLTGNGGNGATGNLTVTTPSGSTTQPNSLVNGGAYNG
jgi:type II secretory pathway pseudopilin PulG